MTYESKIYDITALEIIKRLDVFLSDIVGIKGKITLGEKIVEFKKKYLPENDKEIKFIKPMKKNNKMRNQIVHPDELAKLTDFSPEPIPHLCELNEFEKFRQTCVKLSKELHSKFDKHTGMDEIMIPALKYDMGNAGDIIKHGLIAEFCEWWFKRNDSLIFGDSFGGCPWGWYRPNYEWFDRVEDRIRKIKNIDCALARVYSKAFNHKESPEYLGSSHLVKTITENNKKRAKIYVSDNNPDARSNLKHSGLHLIELPDNNDGYKIFDEQEVYNFNFILIDPYSKFLRDEFSNRSDKQGKFFRKILGFINKHPDVYIAVFILDMKKNFVRENFFELKKEYLEEMSVSLRCPKIEEKQSKGMPIEGESKYDMEILLISKQFEINPDATENLKIRLKDFATEAEQVLPLKDKQNIKFLPTESG